MMEHGVLFEVARRKAEVWVYYTAIDGVGVRQHKHCFDMISRGLSLHELVRSWTSVCPLPKPPVSIIDD